MRIYENPQQIKRDLELLKLKRDISIEELKLVKEDFKEDLSMSSWMQAALKTVAKVGLFRVARKII